MQAACCGTEGVGPAVCRLTAVGLKVWDLLHAVGLKVWDLLYGTCCMQADCCGAEGLGPAACCGAEGLGPAVWDLLYAG